MVFVTPVASSFGPVNLGSEHRTGDPPVIERVALRSHGTRGGSRDGVADGQSLVLFAICLTALVASPAWSSTSAGPGASRAASRRSRTSPHSAADTRETNGGPGPDHPGRLRLGRRRTGSPHPKSRSTSRRVNGDYAPGGAASGPLSSTTAAPPLKYPCWVEVLVNRAHSNSFSRVVGLDTASASPPAASRSAASRTP